MDDTQKIMNEVIKKFQDEKVKINELYTKSLLTIAALHSIIDEKNEEVYRLKEENDLKRLQIEFLNKKVKELEKKINGLDSF